MKLSQYGYDFSADLLAKYPAENRDESRLMVVNRAKGTIEHRIFKEIIEYFDEKDLFIFNDTKVFPARLYGNKEKTGAEIEIFLLRELNASCACGTYWWIRPAKSASATSSTSATTTCW